MPSPVARPGYRCTTTSSTAACTLRWSQGACGGARCSTRQPHHLPQGRRRHLLLRRQRSEGRHLRLLCHRRNRHPRNRHRRKHHYHPTSCFRQSDGSERCDRHVTFDGTTVAIRRSGVMARRLLARARSESRFALSLRSSSSPSGMVRGFIQFTVRAATRSDQRWGACGCRRLDRAR